MDDSLDLEFSVTYRHRIFFTEHAFAAGNRVLAAKARQFEELRRADELKKQTDWLGADVVIDTAGGSATLMASIDMLRPGGEGTTTTVAASSAWRRSRSDSRPANRTHGTSGNCISLTPISAMVTLSMSRRSQKNAEMPAMIFPRCSITASL